MITKNKKRMKLKRWVKVVLYTLLLSTFLISIYNFFTVTTTTVTPVGVYTCHGKLIQVCDGSKEVREYLGVN